MGRISSDQILKQLSHTAVFDLKTVCRIAGKKPATIRHPFQEFPAFDFLAMKKGEILAEKIAAVFTRTTARDLYDMDFLLSSGEKVNTALVSSKLEGYGLKFDRAVFGRRLGMMRILWKVELSPLVKNLGSFDGAKARVMKSIGK